MKLSYQLTGDKRKSLAGAVSSALNAPTKYLGMPTANYEIGGYTLTKAGELIGEDNSDLETALRENGFEAVEREYDKPEAPAPKRKGILDTLVDELNANAEDGEHWERLHRPPTIIDNSGREHNLDGTFATAGITEREAFGLGRERRDPIGEDAENLCGGPQASDVPDTITIEVPFTSCGDLTLAKANLAALLQSKATLINAALGEDAFWYAPPEDYSPENPGGWYGPEPRDNTLPIEFTDDTVKFEWLRFGTDAEVVAAWSAFLCAAIKFSKKAKRVTAKDGAVENEKFHFRAFLVRIGMNDAENKSHRKTLLRNLTGDAAFATAESKARWQAKHLKNAEVADNG
ncbi:MAG: hypothetical protein FWF69_07700 [Firmicutes bacterium]|nr:hypothetical protein [Bacillota bacterium]